MHKYTFPQKSSNDTKLVDDWSFENSAFISGLSNFRSFQKNVDYTDHTLMQPGN